MSDYTVYFLQPYNLLLLLAIPVLIYYLLYLEKKSQKNSEVPFSSLTLLASLLRLQNKSNSFLRYLVLILGLICLIAALASPILKYKTNTASSPLVILLDTSNSMVAQDLVPNRLTAAKQIAGELISELSPDLALGFITYNGSVRIQTELKRNNLEEVIRTLNNLDETDLGPGTATGNALIEASTLIQRYQTDRSDTQNTGVILITDGQSVEGVDPLEAAAVLGRKSVRVYTIGIGTEAGTEVEIRLADGTVEKAQVGGINSEELTRIAELTGGEYTNVIDTEKLARVVQDIALNDLKLFEEVELTIRDYLLILGILLQQLAIFMGYLKQFS